MRVFVARGSIAYSAVSHPSPRPRRQPGTPSSTDTVQSTRVRPNDTRHEPSAYGRRAALERDGTQRVGRATDADGISLSELPRSVEMMLVVD